MRDMLRPPARWFPLCVRPAEPGEGGSSAGFRRCSDGVRCRVGAAMDATVRAVAQALARVDDLPYLQTHPLAGAVGGGKALRGRLLDSIAELGGPAPQRGRDHRPLVLRYLEGLAPAAVQRELGLAKSQYYAEHHRAVAGGRRGVEPAPRAGGRRRAAPPPRRPAWWAGRTSSAR